MVLAQQQLCWIFSRVSNDVGSHQTPTKQRRIGIVATVEMEQREANHGRGQVPDATRESSRRDRAIWENCRKVKMAEAASNSCVLLDGGLGTTLLGKQKPPAIGTKPTKTVD